VIQAKGGPTNWKSSAGSRDQTDLIAQHMIDSQPQIWKSVFPPLEKKASKLQLHTITFPEK
jgi:hypothetical protein